MKVGICLIIKDENEYLEEWLNHHTQLGFDAFYIYDNESKIPVGKYLQGFSLYANRENINVVNWEDNKLGSQMRAYMNCCKNSTCDYVLFIDTDEFLQTKNNIGIKQMIETLKYVNKDFNGLGIYWRMYGSNPYFTERKKAIEYNQYHTNPHIKSLVNPKSVISFPDPHKAIISGNYIDEQGNKIFGPLGKHTSDFIWIKHIWTRSIPEFEEKLKRGSGDKVSRPYTMQNFYDYNNQCLLNDKG